MQARWLLAPVGIVLAATAGFLLGTGRMDARLDRLESRLGRLEHGHRALQDTFLDGSGASRGQLAASLGYHRVAGPDPVRGGAAAARSPRSPREVQAEIQQNLAAMRQSFASEPTDPAWAGTVRQDVHDVLSAVAQQAGTAPRSVEIDCRSRSCMINMDLADTGEADKLLEPFLTEIAADLPSTRMVQVPSADGERMNLVILATRSNP